MDKPLVERVDSYNSVVVGHNTGTINIGGRPLTDLRQHFDLDQLQEGFTGREDLLEDIDGFARDRRRGYIEVTAAAGLGKTALAAHVAKTREAIPFFVGGSGNRRPGLFLQHACAELVLRYGLGRTSVPVDLDTNTLLGQLLTEAARNRPPIWLVVDALDEADDAPPASNPLLLPTDLPDGVYVLVTWRTGDLILAPGVPLLSLTLRSDDARQRRDVLRYLRQRASNDSRIAAVLASAAPPVPLDTFVSQVSAASEGNFMYLRYLLDDIADLAPGSALDLKALPRGLPGYYKQFWDRLAASQQADWDTWERLYEPILQGLAVAREPVTDEWLSVLVARSPKELRARVLQPWRRFLVAEGNTAANMTWRVVHRSFTDYLAAHLDIRDADKALARLYLNRPGPESWDDYGLRHAAYHIDRAARASLDPARSDLARRLGELVVDERLLRAQLEGLGEPSFARQSLELALQLLSEVGSPSEAPLITRIALTHLRLRRSLVRPETAFSAAAEGDLPRALRLLEVIGSELDLEWRALLSLIAVWLAEEARPDAATAALASLRRQCSETAPRGALARLLARIDGDPLEQLPNAPHPYEAAAIVERLAGGDSESLMGGELRDAGGGYLSYLDGLPLVSLAEEAPAVGEQYVDRYIAVHAAYGYSHYRRGSLWHLISALLTHPSDQWAKRRVTAAAVAALAPVRGEFLATVTISARADRAARDPQARDDLDDGARDALAEARRLPPDSVRGAGDTWALHRRRLAAYGEAVARVHGPDAPMAAALIEAALHLPGGFAGFVAPAALTVAESLGIIAADETTIMEARGYALRAAHNIQDPVLCVRMTSRVNAIDAYWWPTPDMDELQSWGDRLASGATAPPFQALHYVGERYQGRVASFPPSEAMGARTLEQIARAHQWPADEVVRANATRHLGPEQILPDGTPVSIPDLGLPPLIASRVAGAALAASLHGRCSEVEANRLIARMVPVAAREPNALATTLGRLLLATPGVDLPHVLDQDLPDDNIEVTPPSGLPG